MLTELFGSATTTKCLIYLDAEGEGYSLEIAKTFRISNTQVTRTLLKLEQGEVLVGRAVGRTRVYSLNKNWFLSKELKAMLDKVILNMPLEDQQKYFMKRQRPRKKHKEV